MKQWFYHKKHLLLNKELLWNMKSRLASLTKWPFDLKTISAPHLWRDILLLFSFVVTSPYVHEDGIPLSGIPHLPVIPRQQLKKNLI